MENEPPKFIRCPFCNKTNVPDAVCCTCGYFFDKNAYAKKEAIEDEHIAANYESKQIFATEERMTRIGILGGIILMVIAIAWFFAAYHYADRIYFYPPILFFAGVISVIRGIVRK